jgi:hypothetical protein
MTDTYHQWGRAIPNGTFRAGTSRSPYGKLCTGKKKVCYNAYMSELTNRIEQIQGRIQKIMVRL